MAQSTKRTHCRRGHPLTPDNLRLHTQPNGSINRRCKICSIRLNKVTCKQWQAKQRRKGLLYSGCTKGNIERTVKRADVERVFELVRQTGLMKSTRGILSRHKLRAFLFFNPTAKATLNKILTTAHADSALLVSSPAILRRANVGARVFDLINESMPRNLAKDHRDDVVSDMWTAWREGRLQAEDIPRRSREFINRRYGMDHNSWGTISLDTPIFQDGNATLADVIPDDRRLWGC